jgi:hypothetical protein
VVGTPTGPVLVASIGPVGVVHAATSRDVARRQ